MSLKNSASIATGKSRHAAGFSLLEVLVALFVISISLLGVAGMQAVSISNTGVSGYRSIAATQANSMAAAMSANEGYWQPGTTTGNISVNGATVTVAGASVTVPTCTSWGGGQTCTAQQLAYYDLSQWGSQLQTALPNGVATVNCVFSGLNICQIQVSWIEKNQAQNQSQSASSTGYSSYHLDMMVQP